MMLRKVQLSGPSLGKVPGRAGGVQAGKENQIGSQDISMEAFLASNNYLKRSWSKVT